VCLHTERLRLAPPARADQVVLDAGYIEDHLISNVKITLGGIA
jgi:hypothetical protein